MSPVAGEGRSWPERRVIRTGVPPMNPKVKYAELSCGHIIWRNRKPRIGATTVCERCSTQMRLAKGDGMKRSILILSALLALSGCYSRPIERRATDNSEITVETLFTKDGCTVYRFLDSGTRYFVRCDSSRHSQVMWEEMHIIGKMVYYEYHSIPTVTL